MEIVFVADAVAASLDDANLVVQAFDKAERHFVLGTAVGGDALPMALDQVRELLEGLQALPAQCRASLVEELSRPCFAPGVPELAELLLEHVRGVQAVVRREQRLQASPFSGDRFARCERSTYFCPLMYVRSGRLVRRWYSALRT